MTPVKCLECGHDDHSGDICLEPIECECGQGMDVCTCRGAIIRHAGTLIMERERNMISKDGP